MCGLVWHLKVCMSDVLRVTSPTRPPGGGFKPNRKGPVDLFRRRTGGAPYRRGPAMPGGFFIRVERVAPMCFLPHMLLTRLILNSSRRLGSVVFSICFASTCVAEVLTWECSFTYRIDDMGRSNEDMFLIFKVGTISERAFMEGNAGIVDVDLHIGDSNFSFMELVGSGSVQTTTITSNGLAVHSRNTVILDEIVAAQHFGNCSFK